MERVESGRGKKVVSRGDGEGRGQRRGEGGQGGRRRGMEGNGGGGLEGERKGRWRGRR